MTFATWAAARDIAVNPEGLAPNLIANHRAFITDALIELQQKVPCLRVGHLDAIPFADTFWDCGASVLDAPRGFITSLSTVTGDACDRVFYTPMSKEDIQCRMLAYRAGGKLLVPYDHYWDPYFPDYMAYSDAATDRKHRSDVGYFTLEHGKFWLYPTIQSTETVWISWDGIKRDWADADVVGWDREVDSAVEEFLRSEIGRTEKFDPLIMKTAMDSYLEKVAQQIWQCRKENRLPVRAYCFNNAGCASLLCVT